MDEIIAFVLKFDDQSDYAGKYVMLDRSSGGYPVAASNLFYASRWATGEEALQYASSFTRESSYATRAIEQKAYVLTASVDSGMLSAWCNGRTSNNGPSPNVRPHPKCRVDGDHSSHEIKVPKEEVPAGDFRPHSRACGWRPHDHGVLCSPNCPTCGGKPQKI